MPIRYKRYEYTHDKYNIIRIISVVTAAARGEIIRKKNIFFLFVLKNQNTFRP